MRHLEYIYTSVLLYKYFHMYLGTFDLNEGSHLGPQKSIHKMNEHIRSWKNRHYDDENFHPKLCGGIFLHSWSFP